MPLIFHGDNLHLGGNNSGSFEFMWSTATTAERPRLQICCSKATLVSCICFPHCQQNGLQAASVVYEQEERLRLMLSGQKVVWSRLWYMLSLPAVLYCDKLDVPQPSSMRLAAAIVLTASFAYRSGFLLKVNSICEKEHDVWVRDIMLLLCVYGCFDIVGQLACL